MYTKKDHSKDEYYLAYSLIDLEHRYNDSKEECPLDNNRIKDGYIECKSTGRGQDNSDNMKFKCFTLHSIVDGDDIVNYAHGDVGYDFNPDSINVFAGGWSDLHTDNNANNIINNKELLSKKKLGLTYVDEKGKVHEMMNNKYQNRVKLFKKAANSESDDESIEKRIFKENAFALLPACIDRAMYAVSVVPKSPALGRHGLYGAFYGLFAGKYYNVDSAADWLCLYDPGYPIHKPAASQ